MKFCVVDVFTYPALSGPPRVPRGIPMQFVGTLADVRKKVPRYLARLKSPRAEIVEYDLLNRGNDVLLRTGFVYATRRIVWHRTRAT